MEGDREKEREVFAQCAATLWKGLDARQGACEGKLTRPEGLGLPAD